MSSFYTLPNNPGSFAGLSGFKKNNPEIKEFTEIKNLDAYSLHKQVKRRFKRRKTIVSSIDECWQIDLIDLKKLATKNSYFKYLLVCIDVFSKYAWVRPLKNKESKSCQEAFKDIFNGGRKPIYIYSDLGNEFKGVCKKYLKEMNVLQIDTKSIYKASVAERFNRTLKNKIARYFTFSKKERYINQLQEFVESYNNSYHSTIKSKPIDVNKNNQQEIYKNLYGADINDITNIQSQEQLLENTIKFEFKIGDYVRIINDKKIFDKGYTKNWSEEYYIINQLIPTNPPTYKIISLDGEEFDWNYYKEELQKVNLQVDTFEVIKSNKKYLEIKQLNSENSNLIKLRK